MNPFGLFLVGAGVFSMTGAALDWDWFMNARKARLVVRLLTRNGARIFYGLLGAGLAATGLLVLTGIIGAPR